MSNKGFLNLNRFKSGKAIKQQSKLGAHDERKNKLKKGDVKSVK